LKPHCCAKFKHFLFKGIKACLNLNTFTGDHLTRYMIVTCIRRIEVSILSTKTGYPDYFPLILHLVRANCVQDTFNKPRTHESFQLQTPISPFANPLNAELNPICYLLALLGVHHFLHVSRIRVNNPPEFTFILPNVSSTFRIYNHPPKFMITFPNSYSTFTIHTDPSHSHTHPKS